MRPGGCFMESINKCKGATISPCYLRQSASSERSGPMLHAFARQAVESLTSEQRLNDIVRLSIPLATESDEHHKEWVTIDSIVARFWLGFDLVPNSGNQLFKSLRCSVPLFLSLELRRIRPASHQTRGGMFTSRLPWITIHNSAPRAIAKTSVFELSHSSSSTF